MGFNSVFKGLRTKKNSSRRLDYYRSWSVTFEITVLNLCIPFRWNVISEQTEHQNTALCHNNSLSNTFRTADRSGTVVKVLCYKSEGRWFDPSWFQWNISLT